MPSRQSLANLWKLPAASQHCDQSWQRQAMLTLCMPTPLSITKTNVRSMLLLNSLRPSVTRFSRRTGLYEGTLRCVVSQSGGLPVVSTGTAFGAGAGLPISGFGLVSLWCSSYSASVCRKVTVRAFAVVVTDILDRAKSRQSASTMWALLIVVSLWCTHATISVRAVPFHMAELLGNAGARRRQVGESSFRLQRSTGLRCGSRKEVSKGEPGYQYSMDLERENDIARAIHIPGPLRNVEPPSRIAEDA